jgi:hypothetical protein
MTSDSRRTTDAEIREVLIGYGIDLRYIDGAVIELTRIMQGLCACASRCGDVPEERDHPLAACKGLPS